MSLNFRDALLNEKVGWNPEQSGDHDGQPCFRFCTDKGDFFTSQIPSTVLRAVELARECTGGPQSGYLLRLYTDHTALMRKDPVISWDQQAMNGGITLSAWLQSWYMPLYPESIDPDNGDPLPEQDPYPEDDSGLDTDWLA